MGASHQTGWTALVSSLAQLFGRVDATTMLEQGKAVMFRRPSPDGAAASHPA